MIIIIIILVDFAVISGPIWLNFCKKTLRNGYKTLRKASVSHAKMAQKPCETQAFRMQNGEKALRNASVSHEKS